MRGLNMRAELYVQRGAFSIADPFRRMKRFASPTKTNSSGFSLDLIIVSQVMLIKRPQEGVILRRV
jgi:hypothetical protein